MLHNDIRSLLEKQSSFYTILFVEDGTRNAKFLALGNPSETPHAVILITNGQEALQILKDIIPDLLILDDHLPEIDVLALHALLRSVQGQEETPVISLNASTLLESVSEIGHREVVLVEKTFELNDLLMVVQYALIGS